MEAVVEEPLHEVPPPPVFTSLNEINIEVDSHTQTNGISSHAPGKENEKTADDVVNVKVNETGNVTVKDELHPVSTTSNVAMLETAVISSLSSEVQSDSPLINVQDDKTPHKSILESTTDSDNVSFVTEVVVVQEDILLEDNNISHNEESEATHNMLSQLEGQGLDEALRSANDSEQNQNNKLHSAPKQEVFNKEELLDILEGNDADASGANVSDVEIALKQLSKLVKKPKKRSKIRLPNVVSPNTVGEAQDKVLTSEKPKDVVMELVKDWEDDETKVDESNEKSLPQDVGQKLNLKENNIVSDSVENSVKQHSEIASQLSETSPIVHDAQTGDNQPNRRLGRVIKKKVIFDPDNPDTFTKGQKTPKNKEVTEKDHTIKKLKIDHVSPRAKSKSPTAKMQWKKPTPKSNIKSNKRLSEVDKLLSDEGAVNMIYQLTPEAPKGRKNMRTKAEFIKKIQSSTPEAKEMKFRERKKELIKAEDGEPRKILGSKQRGSVSGSVQSFSAGDDFEAHSADDSIIYRRHSSSSYSSTCMSPMRTGDLDNTGGLNPNPDNTPTDVEYTQFDNSLNLNGGVGQDIFIKGEPVKQMIDKNDCLSLKQKLNSKLSKVLNKRKREINKVDKPLKHKKVATKDHIDLNVKQNKYKSMSLSFNNGIAEICIFQKYCSTETNYNIETLKELTLALEHVNAKADISVTLITSESGTLYSNLDTAPLLDDNLEKRTNYAFELTENVKLLLAGMINHTKLLVCAVWGPCVGLGLAMALLCEVVLASERSSFAVSSKGRLAVMPGLAVLTHNNKGLRQSLINDLVLCSRQLSAHEARQYGIVTQILWPTRFNDQLNAFVGDIASQPLQSTLLKKKLLNINQAGGADLVKSLCAEQDLVVGYWTSVEGQEAIRASHSPH